MNQGLLNSLTEAERLLVAETERDALKTLDEDELFESVLATVSREVAAVARRASMELRAERIAAGRTATPTPTPATAPAAAKRPAAKRPAAKPATRPRTTKTTGGLKKDASTRALGSRRQAKRDSR